jgi:hypothetical protein
MEAGRNSKVEATILPRNVIPEIFVLVDIKKSVRNTNMGAGRNSKVEATLLPRNAVPEISY